MVRELEKILVAMKDGRRFVELIRDHLPAYWDETYELVVLKNGGDLKIELERIKQKQTNSVAAVVVDYSELFEKVHVIEQYAGDIGIRVFLCGDSTKYDDISDPEKRIVYINPSDIYDVIAKMNDTLRYDREIKAQEAREKDERSGKQQL